MAGKRLTPADVAERLADKVGLTVDQVKALLQAQAELAYASIDQGFPIPGIGVLAKVESPERKLVMRFGPKQGQEVTLAARRKLTFRISQAAKSMILRGSQPMPDLFKAIHVAEFNFSTEATELSDPSIFTADLGGPFTLARDGKQISIVFHRLHDLRLPTGRIVASDGLIGAGKPFSRSVPPGAYPLALAVGKLGADERVALSIIRFSDKRVEKWEMAAPEGRDPSTLKQGEVFGYGVDSGTGSYCDASVQQLVAEANEADIGFSDQIMEEMKVVHKATRHWVHIESPNGSLAIFSTGYGDGFYTSYFGLDEAGNAAALVTDFKIVKWGPLRR